MKLAITGGTGFLGQALARRVDRANVLTRNIDKAKKIFDAPTFAETACDFFAWDSNHDTAPAQAFADVDAVVHLLGESVQGRWTAEKKSRIRSSRIVGSENLVKTLQQLGENAPRVLIAGSAVGFYGDCGDERVTESHAAADDFLADVCQEWEAAVAPAAQVGIRVVNLRTGIVLGRDGGALQAMLTPFKFGLGAKLGDGKQFFPWIHVDDICELILHAVRTSQLDGPVNATAPQPVTNAEFTRALARELKRPAFWPAPAWLLRTVLGEFAEELLASRKVIPEKATLHGFEFRFSSIEAALSDLLR
jgi:uncharacterized protein (TIGR01777 family)